MERLHTTEEFNKFMSQLKETNTNLNFFCDFKKIQDNVKNIEIKLNLLNYLIGKEDVPSAVKSLWETNKECFDVLNILIAVRDKNQTKTTDRTNAIIPIKDFFKTPDRVIEFIQDTGLETVFKDRNIKNLVDYVFGVETGLDSNARKNRSGNIMENTIADIFTKNGIPFKMQINSNKFPPLSVLGEDKKVFDFVVKTNSTTYLIEVNFYSGGGSKLNEVARSYKELSPVINKVPGFEFVWITDGIGWTSAKNKLEDAFYMIKNVYNLTNIKDFVTKVKSEL